MSHPPILLVCGCRIHEAYLRAALSRFSPRSTEDWILVGCVGDPSAQNPVFDEVSRIVTLPVSDTYEDLPKKIHAAFAWVQSQWPDAPGVFKTDDDILLNDPIDLVRALKTHVAEPYWGFITHKCYAAYVPLARVKGRFIDTSKRPKHQAARYCFGHGYWLSAAALRIAVAAASDYATSYLEDVCTGYVMNRAGWEPLRVPVPYREMPRFPELLHYQRPPTENASSR
jgi:hypothetical protein